MKPIAFHGEFEGRYNLIVRDAESLEVKRETGWFNNLITNIGLNRLGTGGVGTVAMVGSGGAAPTVNDTSLQSQIASAGQASTLSGAQASAPYFGWTRVVYRFGQGVAAGNLAEVGVGWGTTSVFSRALIRDADGNPTTITVLSNEILDVAYELRLYPTMEDQAFSFQISGQTHNVVLRPARVNDQSFWSPGNLLEYGTVLPNAMFDMIANSGNIGTVTQLPDGTGDTSSLTNVAVYANNSYKRRFTSSWAIGQANFGAGGIASLAMTPKYTGLGSYQAQLTPHILKNNTQQLSITYDVSWARKV